VVIGKCQQVDRISVRLRTSGRIDLCIISKTLRARLLTRRKLPARQTSQGFGLRRMSKCSHDILPFLIIIFKSFNLSDLTFRARSLYLFLRILRSRMPARFLRAKERDHLFVTNEVLPCVSLIIAPFFLRRLRCDSYRLSSTLTRDWFLNPKRRVYFEVLSFYQSFRGGNSHVSFCGSFCSGITCQFNFALNLSGAWERLHVVAEMGSIPGVQTPKFSVILHVHFKNGKC